MKSKTFLFLSLLLFFACAPNKKESGLSTQIANLELENEKKPSTATSNELIGLYKKYVAENPSDADNNGRYLYRAATLHFRMNQFSPAEKLLKKAIKDYYKSANTPNNALLLSTIYKDHFRNPDAAIAIKQCFLDAFPNHSDYDKVAKSIPKGRASVEDYIAGLGQKLFNDSTKQIEYYNANNFITVSELYAMMLPDSPKSPDILHKAGEVARSVRSFSKAVELYDWIYTKYPNSDKAPQALFLKAFTLDNELKKYDDAKVLYEEFLQKYPDADFADDTEFLLKNLGKSEEEIIKNFEKKPQ